MNSYIQTALAVEQIYAHMPELTPSTVFSTTTSNRYKGRLLWVENRFMFTFRNCRQNSGLISQKVFSLITIPNRYKQTPKKNNLPAHATTKVVIYVFVTVAFHPLPRDSEDNSRW